MTIGDVTCELTGVGVEQLANGETIGASDGVSAVCAAMA